MIFTAFRRLFKPKPFGFAKRTSCGNLYMVKLGKNYHDYISCKLYKGHKGNHRAFNDSEWNNNDSLEEVIPLKEEHEESSVIPNAVEELSG